MKITLLKVRKNMIRRMLTQEGVLAASALARVRTGPNTQVWAFFDYDLPGQARWHLWSGTKWVTGHDWAMGPLGSPHSIFEYPTEEGGVESGCRITELETMLETIADNVGTEARESFATSAETFEIDFQASDPEGYAIWKQAVVMLEGAKPGPMGDVVKAAQKLMSEDESPDNVEALIEALGRLPESMR